MLVDIDEPLTGMAERIERAGLGQRLDRAFVERRRVDPFAEVVEVGEGATGFARAAINPTTPSPTLRTADSP